MGHRENENGEQLHSIFQPLTYPMHSLGQFPSLPSDPEPGFVIIPPEFEKTLQSSAHPSISGGYLSECSFAIPQTT